MSEGGDCRTAPATPGLLIRIHIRKRKLDEVGLPPTLAPLLQDTSVELQ